MCIRDRYYSYKVEFALRGAAHIHGVLWTNWNKFTALDTDDSGTKNVDRLVSAFDKIRNDLTLDDKDKEALINFADLSITCSKKDFRTKEIVEEVQTHHHTMACRKYGTKCRFSFPRFPCFRTIVSIPFNKLDCIKEEQKQQLEQSQSLLKKMYELSGRLTQCMKSLNIFDLFLHLKIAHNSSKKI